MPKPSQKPRKRVAGQPIERAQRSGPPDLAAALTVVAIGASAGGLEACTKLMEAMPPEPGMAFVLVQHLDPDHESLMVDLLAGHTAMTVRQAEDGLELQANNLYVIPPGTYLAVESGTLRVRPPTERHGARFPFDYLMHSLASEMRERAVCVLLSGSGADGSLGLKSVREHGGLVVVQDPEEAGFDGMPRSAICTGMVDLVLPVAEMPEALARHHRRSPAVPLPEHKPASNGVPDGVNDWLAEVVELLRTKTSHDFTLYKHGTLQRRIERRMAMAAFGQDDARGYIDMLRGNTAELDVLAKDLLINVTSFFRDPHVFRLLEESAIPDMIRRGTVDGTMRIWVAGCSTGEETYSLAMLLCEQLASAGSELKLQVFASDIDADAVATAREALYPLSIEADIAATRLTRFFNREETGYRVKPELRGVIIFAVQDVLADPPFSRLDMVSCRNLMIYLQPEAQAKVISLFDFALREDGLLLLGSAETVGQADSHFEAISKAARLYRHIGRSWPHAVRHGDAATGTAMTVAGRSRAAPAPANSTARQGALAELGRRMVLNTFAPACVLVSATNECLYSLGPTDRFLRMPPGHPTSDLLAVVRPGMRAKLSVALQQARSERRRIVIDGGRLGHDGHTRSFAIDVQPVQSAGEHLLLVCFVDQAQHAEGLEKDHAPARAAGARTSDLRQELEATRAELQAALRDLEASGEEQNALNEEASSVKEEYQSTNEELLTSKEELQSLNEELTALNSQLQATLERQRTTSDDLTNVLYSTDIATLFLDLDLKIRFFTPASRALFNIIASDIGRPLADLNSLASGGTFAEDARSSLKSLLPVEREVEADGHVWCRRVLPYRAHDTCVEGVVITFTDVTERKIAGAALDAAKQQSEAANQAKSRFLAAASHDLRQPLQTLTLLHGLLAKAVQGEKAEKLIVRLDETLRAMSGMLNTLLDINQIESGVVVAKMVMFPIDEMLDRLRGEFTYHAQAQGLQLHVVGCSLHIQTDPRLLEQMVRNLLANALKYTKRGKILLGCRRQAGVLSIEIWDTGIGIADDQLSAIFEEYHQLDNAARERVRGLGLGLSIVKRLGNLLGHGVHVRSSKGRGSVFAIDILRDAKDHDPEARRSRNGVAPAAGGARPQTGVVLIVEDDPDVRELLQLFLQDEGHLAATTRDGNAALDLVTRGMIRPDLIIADYNLPSGLNGLQLAVRIRESFGPVPVIILTGDISDETMRSVAQQDCVQLNKPVKLTELTDIIQRLLGQGRAVTPPAAPEAGSEPSHPHVFVVDDDIALCEATCSVLEGDGYTAQAFPTSEAFLQAYRPGRHQCLLIDAALPGMSGLKLLRHLRDAGHHLPAIMITGQSDVPMAVQAMKAGAADFIEKPVGGPELLAGIARALELAHDSDKLLAWREDAADHLAGLTPRQHEIMAMVLAGHPSKNIAADLDISQRTVENHRAAIMKKTGSASLPALARLALAAAWTGPGQPKSSQP